MIKKLKIENFKSVQELELELGDFNLFCGTNSSGKSTILHALLILTQNSEIKKDSKAILNGTLVQLGDFTDIKNFDKSSSENIIISGTFNKDDSFIFKLENKLGTIPYSNVVAANNIDRFRFENSVFYLSSNRIGDVELHESANNNQLGSRGQFAIDYFNNNSMKIINARMVHENHQDSNFVTEVNYWLKRIVGAELEVSKVDHTSKLVTTYRNLGSRDFVRSINIGTGISYLISIIIVCFAVVSNREDNTNPIIIIENPEIHLHPKAQSNVTEFLLFISKFAQVIVETQSDHVFNRFRIFAKESRESSSIIDKKSPVGKVFFSKYEKNRSIFDEIIINNKGTITNDKKDLFDQFDIDLMKLL